MLKDDNENKYIYIYIYIYIYNTNFIKCYDKKKVFGKRGGNNTVHSSLAMHDISATMNE